jgi:hypothetical protein
MIAIVRFCRLWLLTHQKREYDKKKINKSTIHIHESFEFDDAHISGVIPSWSLISCKETRKVDTKYDLSIPKFVV